MCRPDTTGKVQKPMNTKKTVALIIVALSTSIGVQAQTYLDHLRQNKGGKGSVVVVQSKEIDNLVNGTGKPSAATKGVSAEAAGKVKAAERSVSGTAVAGKTDREMVAGHDDAARAEAARREAEARRMAENRSREAAKNEKEEGETEATTVDMRKKVMRGSRKVTGYRVQAFAGGNTRNDKQRAQKIGNDIKMKFPDQPVYVHFYSPRWICRVGNFRSYQEAQAVLRQVRAMGHKSATIVKGQITVQY